MSSLCIYNISFTECPQRLDIWPDLARRPVSGVRVTRRSCGPLAGNGRTYRASYLQVMKIWKGRLPQQKKLEVISVYVDFSVTFQLMLTPPLWSGNLARWQRRSGLCASTPVCQSWPSFPPTASSIVSMHSGSNRPCPRSCPTTKTTSVWRSMMTFRYVT